MTSNNFTFQGVSFTVLKANTEASVSVSKDVDAVYEKIVQFTDKFNNLLGTLNTLYNEEKNSDYEPLTDAEREGLSDTQEEKWEKLAKAGILRRDSTVKEAISQMRQAVVGIINTEGAKSLFEIGINTTAYDPINTANNGKIVINEDKLKEAIRNNTDTVANLFASAPSNIQGTLFEDGQTLNLTGKSMQIQFNGITQTIEFTRDYNLAVSADKDEFEEYMNSQLDKYFGSGNLSASISSGRFILTSIRKGDVTVNSGGVDALAELGVNDGAKYDSSQRGFATKIYDIMSTAMNSVTEKAGSSSTTVDDSTLGQKMKRLNQYISKQESRLETLENRYYTQFAAMEQAISNMNSQSSYISNMLGSK
jgi:flagellar capping protein FliD